MLLHQELLSKKLMLWKFYLTLATMSSEIILSISPYVIASVLTTQAVRVSSERPPNNLGYEHPIAIVAGGQMFFGL